jgi:MFS family permease
MPNVTSIQVIGFNPAGAAPAPRHDEKGRVCVANIDTAGRRRRLLAGIVELVAGAGLLAVLLALHANPLWRLPLLFVFWGAAIGFFQWHDRT